MSEKNLFSAPKQAAPADFGDYIRLKKTNEFHAVKRYDPQTQRLDIVLQNGETTTVPAGEVSRTTAADEPALQKLRQSKK